MKKMKTNGQHAMWALALAVAVPMSLVSLGGCSKEPEPTAIEQGLHVGWGVYDVRGVVVSLPEGGADLVIRHEAIGHFVSIKGEMVGMQAMQMPFPLAAGVSLEGIGVDDLVAFTFEVDWDPSYAIIAIEVLPAGTELDFSFKEVPTVYETGP